MREYLNFLQESSNRQGYCIAFINGQTPYRIFNWPDIVQHEEELKALFESAYAAVSGDAVKTERVEEQELTFRWMLYSSRYAADYIYGSEAIRAQYQADTKDFYDRCGELKLSWNSRYCGDNPLPPYNPDLCPADWDEYLYEDQIHGNDYFPLIP